MKMTLPSGEVAVVPKFRWPMPGLPKSNRTFDHTGVYPYLRPDGNWYCGVYKTLKSGLGFTYTYGHGDEMFAIYNADQIARIDVDENEPLQGGEFYNYDVRSTLIDKIPGYYP
jgi:hypothetical protein